VPQRTEKDITHHATKEEEPPIADVEDLSESKSCCLQAGV
jgi:hypothetical protein